MIWHPTGAGGATASITVDGMVLAVLHAYPDSWQIEDMVSRRGGRATTLPGAKRQALEAVADLLAKASEQVHIALHTG